MEGKKLIYELSISELLSFGNKRESVELQPLNVLIGPNASGKSNLIEIIRLLHSLPDDFARAVREAGGAAEIMWKGDRESIAEIKVKIRYPPFKSTIDYTIEFTAPGYFLHINDEKIQVTPSRKLISELPARVSGATSLLAEVKDGYHYPEIVHLSKLLKDISIYKDWDFGRNAPVRMPQRPDLPGTVLLEDASNLGLILNNYPRSIKDQIIERLRSVYDGIEDIVTRIDGGTIQTSIKERGFYTAVPAIRFSEGTLRYLCLLALLLNPSPPSLICIEEPEIGLHPHVLPKIAELLIEASRRTQLIVTTHSDALISGLTEVPESIIVCERDQDGSHLRRLDPEQIKPWLDRYALGDLWRMGEIGGTRW
jgi:predicted ATPase